MKVSWSYGSRGMLGRTRLIYIFPTKRRPPGKRIRYIVGPFPSAGHAIHAAQQLRATFGRDIGLKVYTPEH